jgi:hypothetical protein
VIRAALLVLAVLALGCGSAQDVAIRSLNASAAVLTQENAGLAELHRGARDRAIAEADTPAEARTAVALVHSRFRPAWEAYTAARASWLAAAAGVQAAALAAAAGAGNPGAALAAVAEVAEALRRLQDATRALAGTRSSAPPASQHAACAGPRCADLIASGP